MNKIVLSKRLQTIADMVTAGSVVCDVGCDHAHIVIDLVERGIIPGAIAMDIHTGPLERAQEQIVTRSLSHAIETRLSDGFKSLNMGEADTIIISGIGGRLMQSILAEAPKKTASFKELILGPQSEIPAFRGYLRRNGFRTVNEEMILEDDKYYPIMKVIPGPIDHTETEMTIIADCYGQILLKERHPILLMYLKREQRITVEIIKEINNTRYLNKKSEQKLAELRKKAAELADLIMLW